MKVEVLMKWVNKARHGGGNLLDRVAKLFICIVELRCVALPRSANKEKPSKTDYLLCFLKKKTMTVLGGCDTISEWTNQRLSVNVTNSRNYILILSMKIGLLCMCLANQVNNRELNLFCDFIMPLLYNYFWSFFV